MSGKKKAEAEVGGVPPSIPSLDIEALLADIEANPATVTVSLGAYGTYMLKAQTPAEYRALLLANPPTSEQFLQFQAAQDVAGIPLHRRTSLGHNVDTYPPALIAACCVSPAMTLEQAQRLWATLGNGEAQELLEAAQSICLPRKLRPRPEA